MDLASAAMKHEGFTSQQKRYGLPPVSHRLRSLVQGLLSWPVLVAILGAGTIIYALEDLRYRAKVDSQEGEEAEAVDLREKSEDPKA
jgi:hypothetical protein